MQTMISPARVQPAGPVGRGRKMFSGPRGLRAWTVAIVAAGVVVSVVAAMVASTGGGLRMPEAVTVGGQAAPPAAVGPKPAGAPVSRVSSAPAVGAPAAAGSAAGAAPAAADAVSPNALSSSAAPSAAGATQSLDRMVLRTAQLGVEVTDMEGSLAQVRAIAQRGGGYVSSSTTRQERVNGQERTVADLTLQVRSDVADSAISDLRSLGKVTTESSGSQDVTEEYVDLDANLRNLQASESAIVALMAKATRIEDVLALQRELTNVRGQIERIQGRKRFLERRSDMATITVSLRLPSAEAGSGVTGAGTWNPLAVAARGFQASLGVLRAAADAVIVALAFSWWLLPFAAAGVYVFMHRRRATAPGQAQLAVDA